MSTVTPRPPLPLAEAPLHAEVIRTGRTLLLAPDAEAHAPHQPQAWLGVPLQTSNGVLGVLVLQGSHYTDKDKDLLQFVSTQVAAAVERKQTLERLRQMAQYDQLTQLPNRQLFLDRLRPRWRGPVATTSGCRCCSSTWTVSRR